LLAGLGVYGVTSYTVAGRRTEFGIRMALGASASRIVWLAISRISVTVGIGIAVGAVIAMWLSHFLSTLLYGLQPRDSLTLLGASAVLGTTALLAGWVPAWRASRTDPMETLRES
jgi:putative ABC transport system permease protein